MRAWKLAFVLMSAMALASNAAIAQTKDVLSVDLPADAATLDPHVQWDTDSYAIYRNIFDNLLTRDAKGEIVGQIATAWRNIDDTHVEFDLRSDVKFHDGTPFNADAVKWNLDRQKDPKNNCRCAFYIANVLSVEPVDDLTVVYKLKDPAVNFPALLTRPDQNNTIHSPAAIESKGDDYNRNPVGTGPYVLKSYTTNSTFEFEANPNYWGTKPAITAATVRIVTDGTAGLNALEAGEVDAVPVITIDLWEQLTKRELDKKFTLVTYPQIGEPTYAVFNQKLDPELRQALAETLDRQSYNDAFGAAWGAENTCTFALPNQPWYSPESADSCPYPYNYEDAMAKAAKWASTPLEYASLSDVPDLSLPADIMIPAMQGAGFNVTRNAIDLARYSQLIFQGRPPQFDITVMSGDAEPTQWACPSPDKAGWSTYCSAEYTKALSDADAAPSDEEYLAKMKEAADILRKDAVIVPLIAKKGVGLFDAELKGFLEPRVLVAIEIGKLHW